MTVFPIIPLNMQVGDVKKWGLYWTKFWEQKMVVHQFAFYNLKIYVNAKRNMKTKIQNNLGTAPVPGPQVFLDASRGIIKMQLVHKILKYNTFCLFNPILMSHDVIYLWIILLIIFLWINLWIIFESFCESFLWIIFFWITFWIIFLWSILLWIISASYVRESFFWIIFLWSISLWIFFLNDILWIFFPNHIFRCVSITRSRYVWESHLVELSQ